MEVYLYRDLKDKENTHWWHISKTELVSLMISKYVKSSKKIKILDVGCGTGKNVKELSKFGEAHGIDASAQAVRFCKKSGLSNVKQASAEKIPFEKESFDLVTILDVLEHVDDRKALEEIQRISKKDGYLILTVPAFPWLWSRWDEVLNHRRRYTKESLEKVLKNSGFQILKISYVYSFLVLPSLVIRTLKNRIYKKKYPSDFALSNRFLNSLLLVLSRSERKILLKYSIPFGTSLVCLAKKR